MTIFSPDRIYLATLADSAIDQSDDLHELINELVASWPECDGEDITIWSGSKVAAIIHFNGSDRPPVTLFGSPVNQALIVENRDPVAA